MLAMLRLMTEKKEKETKLKAQFDRKDEDEVEYFLIC